MSEGGGERGAGEKTFGLDTPSVAQTREVSRAKGVKYVWRQIHCCGAFDCVRFALTVRLRLPEVQRGRRVVFYHSHGLWAGLEP